MCNLRTRTLPCARGCGDAVTSTLSAGSADNDDGNLACLQALVDEENFEEVRYQLYIKEIQRLNPSLREGCMFVDGLYELVCSRLPVQFGKGYADLKNSARDFLTLHTTDMLLLQKYWHKPQDQDDNTTYITVGTSFVHYVFTKFGPRGVSEFLQRLDYTVDDPLTEGFRFKRQDIVRLEFKWKKFVEAEVNANFRLSVLGMLHLLFTRYLLHYWLRIIIVLLLILADVALEFLYSLAFAELIALGFTRGPMNRRHLFQWVGVLISTLMVRFAVLLTSAGILVTMAVSVSSRIRAAISDRFRYVTPLYLADHSSSSLLTTFSQDVNVIEKVISTAVRAIVVALVLVATCFIWCAVIVWPLALYLAGLFILSQFLNHFVSTRLSINLFAKAQASGKMCDILKEQTDGFLVARIYRLADLWKGQLQEIIHRYYTAQASKALFFTNFCWFFQQMVPNVSIATMLFGIILLSREGFMDFTSGISVFLFYIRVSVGLTSAASMFPELQAASTAMGRINALLSNKAHEIDATSSKEDRESSSHSYSHGSMVSSIGPPGDDAVMSLPIEFRGVCFTYKMSAAHWNLYNVSLDIKAGERVVIVGTTGSGKSTLLMLTMQLYKPTIGEVVIGGGKSPFFHGVPKISTTFQNNHMFNMSLRENIRLGNLAASNEEVEDAARKADIHDWVTTLARGYDTPVQSGGTSLSGGQRQRIAIARMLVAKSPICLLDEVTSALDPVTESKVFSKLMEITKGRTVLAITHKLEQARHFDRILVLSHGRVKEMGSHSGLMAHRGVYWRMCNNDVNISPGRPVPIPQRRSSGALQMGETPLQPPELSIVPLTTPRESAGTLVYPDPTPTFVPLQAVVEAGESQASTVISRTLQTTGNSDMYHSTVEAVPIITVETTSAGVDETGHGTEAVPRQSSTPVLRANRPGREEGGASHTITQLPLPHSDPDTSALTPSPPDLPSLGKERRVVSLSMEGLQTDGRPETFDMNQSLPTCLVESQTGTGLRRHPNMKFHSGPAAQQEGPLRAQLEEVLRSENSLTSLASFFHLDIGGLAAVEEERRGSGEGEGSRDESVGSNKSDMTSPVAIHC